MKKTGAAIALIALVMIMGVLRSASASECDPDEALLWLRLGMAIGEENTVPTREELNGLLASLQEKPISKSEPYDQPPSPGSVPEASWIDNPADETFWIRLGMPEARMVYMAIDPTCPYCSQALRRLPRLIRDGDLQVRIILVPFLNEYSAPLAAELLLNDNPADAIWQHEITNRGKWQGSINPASVEEIGETGRMWLQTNLEWMARTGFNSVPLYIWAEPGGDGTIEWKVRTGVQEPDVFMAALPPQEPDEIGFGIPTATEEIQDNLGNSDTRSFLGNRALPLK